MPQPMDELPAGVLEKARQFVTLQTGKHADKGWAASALLRWIAESKTDETETTLDSIAGAAFAQLPGNADDEDYSSVSWIAVLREMEARGLGKLVLGRHGWPTRFVWERGSSLAIACAVLELPFPHARPYQETAFNPARSRTGPIPPTKLSIGRIEVRLPLGGASEEEWAELARWVTRRGEQA